MPSFLTTTYTEEPGKMKNPPRFEAAATGRHVLPGEAAHFGDRSYTVAPDGSIRRERHVRISKKLRRKIRAAAKAAQS